MQQKFAVTTSLGMGVWILALLLVPFGMAPAAAEQACGALEVDNAWVRLVPGAPVSAAYFDLENTGDAAVKLVAVTSPQFGRAHMHESVVTDDGEATMQPVNAVVIRPGETVAFAPGGYHVMLFEPTQTLAPGDAVTLQLQCSGGDASREVTAVVRNAMAMGEAVGDKSGSHMHMQHGD